MSEIERAREPHPDNVIFWRLAALEEAMKFQAGQLEGLRDQLAREPDRIEREFPSRLELQRDLTDYVKRGELREESGDRRDVWTLRLVVAGLVLSNAIALAGLFIPH